jgi:hypothetical protein
MACELRNCQEGLEVWLKVVDCLLASTKPGVQALVPPEKKKLSGKHQKSDM